MANPNSDMRVTRALLSEYAEKYKNWGKWGPDDEIGTLKTGSIADISVFSIEDGNYKFIDAHGNQENGSKMITPTLTVRMGKLYYPEDLSLEVAETVRRANEMVEITGLPYGAIRDIKKEGSSSLES